MEFATTEEMKEAVWPMWESGKRRLPERCELEIKRFGDGGSYFLETGKIELGLEQIKQDVKNWLALKGEVCSEKQNAQLTLAHEMGHAEDESLLEKNKDMHEALKLAGERLDKEDEIGFMIAHAKAGEIRRAFEKKAWKLGEAFLPEGFDMELYQKAEEYFLWTYEWLWRQEQEAYLKNRKLVKWMRERGLSESPPLSIRIFGKEEAAYKPEKKSIAFSFAAAERARRFSKSDLSLEEAALFLCLRETARAEAQELETRMMKMEEASNGAYRACAAGDSRKTQEKLREWEAGRISLESEIARLSEKSVCEELKSRLRAFNAEREEDEKSDMAHKREFVEQVCKERAEEKTSEKPAV